MKFSIRRNVFETNSSSTHSITMCTESDYDKWKKGETVFSRWEGKFITTPEGYKEYKYAEESTHDYRDLYSFDQFFNLQSDYDMWQKLEYETYVKTYTTPLGEKIVAFGYYGHD